MATDHSVVEASSPAESHSPDPGDHRLGDSPGQPHVEEAEYFFCTGLEDRRATSGAVAAPVGLTGLLMCCLVIAAILKFQPHKPTNFFLVSLACSGILQGIVQLLIAYVNASDKLFLSYHSSEVFCLTRIALSHVAHVSFFNNIFLVAVDHYLYLVEPLCHYRLITKHSALAGIAWSWLFSIGYGLLAFYVKIKRTYSCCAMTEVVPRYYEYYIPLCHFLACLTFCGLVYGTISCVSLRFQRQAKIEGLARKRIADCRDQRSKDVPASSGTHSFRARWQSLLPSPGLNVCEILRSFRLFLFVMAIFLGLWGTYFLRRMRTEFGDSSSTFGSHEDCDSNLSMVSLSAVMLCYTYVYTNTEIRNAVIIYIFGRRNGGPDVSFRDFDMADMIYNLLHSMEHGARVTVESENQTLPEALADPHHAQAITVKLDPESDSPAPLAALSEGQQQQAAAEDFHPHLPGSTQSCKAMDTEENTVGSAGHTPLAGMMDGQEQKETVVLDSCTQKSEPLQL